MWAKGFFPLGSSVFKWPMQKKFSNDPIICGVEIAEKTLSWVIGTFAVLEKNCKGREQMSWWGNCQIVDHVVICKTTFNYGRDMPFCTWTSGDPNAPITSIIGNPVRPVHCIFWLAFFPWQIRKVTIHCVVSVMILYREQQCYSILQLGFQRLLSISQHWRMED